MRSLGAFIAFPALALVPAAVFGVLAYRTRSHVAGLAAAVWLLYAVYETAMTAPAKQAAPTAAWFAATDVLFCIRCR